MQKAAPKFLKRRSSCLLARLEYECVILDEAHRARRRIKHVQRLAAIHGLFGQIPDTLEAAWIETALGNNEAVIKEIDALPTRHPLETKCRQISQVDFETYSKVLNSMPFWVSWNLGGESHLPAITRWMVSNTRSRFFPKSTAKKRITR